MVSEAQCDPSKIDIVPNATRESNLLPCWEEARWQASRQGTWQVRAAMVITALKRRWQGELDAPDHLPEFDPNTAYPEPVPPRQLLKFEVIMAD